MNKLSFNILPFLLLTVAMKEGEEKKPSRTELFIQKLGLSEEIQKQLANEEANIEEVVGKFKNDFGGLLKQNHYEKWDKDKEEEIIKNTRIGTYNSVEKKIADSLGLSLDDYKEIDKGRVEHMLKAAKKSFELNVQEWKTKASKSKDLPALEQYEKQLKAANEELKELRKIKEDFPNQIALAKQGLLHDIYRKDHVRTTLSKLRKENQIVDFIDDETILMHLNSVAILEVAEKEGEKSIAIKDKNGKPYMRSATDNYKDVGALIVEKILGPRKWVKKSNGKPEGEVTQMGKGGQQQTGKFKINQKAIDAANGR
jgi:hypothetical protein